MTSSAGFVCNFEDVTNFVSRIYCPKTTLNDGTDFEAKIEARMDSDLFSVSEMVLSSEMG